jgi:hypothetical protein
MIQQIEPSILAYNRKFQDLCMHPFYGHSHGCPNYGRKIGCPPNQSLIDKVLDFENELYAIYTAFRVGEFAQRMRDLHPEWSQQPRQWYNPRRWQPTSRKQHQNELITFLREYRNMTVITVPEAHGINVTDLLSKLGITLNWEWPPKHALDNLVYTVSIAGFSLDHRKSE